MRQYVHRDWERKYSYGHVIYHKISVSTNNRIVLHVRLVEICDMEKEGSVLLVGCGYDDGTPIYDVSHIFLMGLWWMPQVDLRSSTKMMINGNVDYDRKCRKNSEGSERILAQDPRPSYHRKILVGLW